MIRSWRPLALLVGLAVLAALPYLRALTLPLIEDDYLQVHLGRQYGPVSGWPALAGDPLYRSRATSLVLTYWTEHWFGVSALAFSIQGILLHILNTWLLFAVGVWKRIGWRVSAVAAAFFAIYDGHQEAVIWFSALPELLLFFFSLGCIVLWILWLNHRGARANPLLYLASLACFVLALFSKESAVVLIPLLGLLTWAGAREKFRYWGLIPPAALALAYTVAIFAGQSQNHHFRDGTFSLHAPFWIVWTNSFGRLLWVWGAISLFALCVWRARPQWGATLRIAFLWISITLLPYCFLTYMPRIPSRHTYLASAGLGLVVAAALITLRERVSWKWRWAPAAVAAVVLIQQCGYVWTRKHAQFVERAQPTETLLRYVRSVDGPIHIHCFRHALSLAQLVVEIGCGKPASILVPDPSPSPDVPNVFCMGNRNHRSMMRPRLPVVDSFERTSTAANVPGTRILLR